MTDYKPHYVNPDNYKSMDTRLRHSYFEMTANEWARYFRNNGIYTQAKLDEIRANLESRIANDESTWWQKLMGQLWYRLILPKSKDLLTPKNLLAILKNLDHLLPYMPTDFWRSVLKALDKAATYAYDRMD